MASAKRAKPLLKNRMGTPQTVGGLKAGQYVDVTQDLVLTDLPSRSRGWGRRSRNQWGQ